MVRPARDVDKVELACHLFGHAAGEACQLFAYVFFECGSAPAAHFVYFTVRIAGQGQGICAAAPKGVCVDSLYGDELSIVAADFTLLRMSVSETSKRALAM